MNENAKRKGDIRNQIMEDFKVMLGDEIIEHEGKEKMSNYENHMRKFNYTKALDSVLHTFVTERRPHHVVAILNDLHKRNALKIALAGRNARKLSPITRFIIKNIRDPRFKRVLLCVANNLMEVYEDSIEEYPFLIKFYRKLKQEIDLEVKNSMENISMIGIIEMFLSSSNQGTSTEPASLKLDVLESSSKPSVKQKSPKLLVEVT